MTIVVRARFLLPTGDKMENLDTKQIPETAYPISIGSKLIHKHWGELDVKEILIGKHVVEVVFKPSIGGTT